GIAGLASGIADVDRRFAEAESHAAEQWHRIGERLGHLELVTEGRAYEQAIGFAEQGGDTNQLITCFGLTEGEADLVHLLHGGAGRAKQAGGDEHRNKRAEERQRAWLDSLRSLCRRRIATHNGVLTFRARGSAEPAREWAGKRLPWRRASPRACRNAWSER